MVTSAAMRKLVSVLGIALLLTACGGNEATPIPTSSPPASAAAANTVADALAALKSQHESWQFTTTTYEAGPPSFSRTLKGTQSPKPPSAVGFTVTQPGKPTLKYVRLGTDVWYDNGTGSFSETKADDSYMNLDFQQFYLDTMLLGPETRGYQFDEVGEEAVGGIAATHYRLADVYVESIVGATGVPPADWAADVWVGDADGSLLRVTWGPQSVDDAQAQTGFDYTVTSVDCDCPVKPPTSVGS